MRLYIIETSSKKFKNSSNFFIKKYNLLTISALFLPRKFAPTCGISPLWHPCHYDIQWTFSSTWQDFSSIGRSLLSSFILVYLVNNNMLDNKYSKIPQKIQQHNRKKPFSSLLSQSLLERKEKSLIPFEFLRLSDYICRKLIQKPFKNLAMRQGESQKNGKKRT